jgi:Adenylate and Guanylate cyclase catalytic domain
MERTLGPDTGELMLRFGLHSGPYTAGFLRAERARYQIFGDTVNVAASMESTGEPGQIQISQELLAAAKKSSWFIPRDNLVEAKGKGKIQTYWLHPNRGDHGSKLDEPSSDTDTITQHWLDPPASLARTTDALRAHVSGQNHRLVEWNASQLPRLLNCMVKQRNTRNALKRASGDLTEDMNVENIHLDWNAQSSQCLTK